MTDSYFLTESGFLTSGKDQEKIREKIRKMRKKAEIKEKKKAEIKGKKKH